MSGEERCAVYGQNTMPSITRKTPPRATRLPILEDNIFVSYAALPSS